MRKRNRDLLIMALLGFTLYATPALSSNLNGECDRDLHDSAVAPLRELPGFKVGDHIEIRVKSVIPFWKAFRRGIFMGFNQHGDVMLILIKRRTMLAIAPEEILDVNSY